MYQQLVQDDMLHFALEQIEVYAETALQTLPNDSALWVLMGRLHWRNGETKKIARSF